LSLFGQTFAAKEHHVELDGEEYENDDENLLDAYPSHVDVEA